MADDVVLEMGWGRLIFGQTFSDHAGIETALRDERLGRRDIALYMRDPHILVSRRPQDLFVDPSFTYRINLHSYRARRDTIAGVVTRNVNSLEDCEEKIGRASCRERVCKYV